MWQRIFFRNIARRSNFYITSLNMTIDIHPLEKFKYCPKCGSKHFDINNEKSKKCDNCGFTYYLNRGPPTGQSYSTTVRNCWWNDAARNRQKACSTCPEDSATMTRRPRRVSPARYWRRPASTLHPRNTCSACRTSICTPDWRYTHSTCSSDAPCPKGPSLRPPTMPPNAFGCPWTIYTPNNSACVQYAMPCAGFSTLTETGTDIETLTCHNTSSVN